MATIKGITIEIDGNTTGLSKSLEGINKQINSTSYELRQVNSLLKLDPTNTDLLAQKQKLLTDAVQQTSEKLRGLQDAQQKVNDGTANMSEENYRALEREIIKTQQSLNGLSGNLKDTEDALNNVGNNGQADIKKLTDEAKNADRAFKGIDFKELGSQLSDFGSKAGHVAGQIGQVTAGLVVGLGAGLSLVGKKMFDGAVSAGEFADELLVMSDVTNLSAETLQMWSYASGFVDVELTTITDSMRKMTKSLGTNEEAFKKLGVATRDSGGNLRSQEEIFMDTIDALGGIENATERDIASLELFGKTATELNPLIKAGGDELRRLSEEAIASGVIISGTVLEQFAQFDDTMNRLKEQFGALSKNIVAGFLPTIEGLVAPLQASMGQINVILSDGLQAGDMEQITTIVADMVESLGQQIVNLVPKLIDFLIPAINSLINVLVGVMPTLLPTLLDGVFQLIMGLVGAVKTNVKPLVDMANTMVTNIADFIVNNLPTVLQVGLELLIALVQGIVEALPTLIPQLIQVILSMVKFFYDNLPTVIKIGIELLLALVNGLIGAIPMLVEEIPTIIEAIVDALVQNIGILIMGAIQLMIGLAVGLVKAIPSLIKVIPQINNAIVNGLMEGLGSMVNVGRDLVAGIWEGISNSLTWIKNKLTGWVGDVTKFIKKLFGIASPSKVMEKQVGLNLGLGVAEGIEGSLGAVHGAMAKLNSEVTASVNPVINPTANSNPLILQIENFINDRGTSIEQLMQEAEFLRRNTALAGGIK